MFQKEQVLNALFFSLDSSEDPMQRHALHRSRVEHVVHRVLQAARSV